MTTLPVLRRSAVQTAMACLYRYRKIWVEGAPDMSDPALIGIGFHACANAYITRLWQVKLESDHEESKRAFQDGIATAQTPAPLIPEVRRIYTKWAEHFTLDLKAFLAAEEHQLSDTQQTFTPDLVYGREGELEIKDFKTYRVAYTEAQVREDWQARWYVYNARRIWPRFPAYRFTHEYVRMGTFTTVVFTPADLDTFAEEVAAIAGTIEQAEKTGIWPATPGKECAFCELQCPVVDHPAVVPKRVMTLEQANLLGQYILAGESVMKVAKKTLKAWAAANGAVDVAGVVFDNRPQLQRTYPIDQVVKALEKWQQAGALSPEEGLTVSHSSLTKVFRKYPEMEQALSPFVQAKTTYRFSARKPGVGDDEED